MHAANLAPDAGAADFRAAVRAALAAGLAPREIVFAAGGEGALFGPPPEAPADFRLTAPRAFVELMELVACHRAADRFGLLYDVLWRLKHGEPDLLSRASDPSVARLGDYAKAVRRDIHKMHAFVRFHECRDADGERFVAWFEPKHFILRRAAPFFRNRFAQMRWSILTPVGGVFWDGARLEFGPPCEKPELEDDRVLGELWNAYYRTIFNPARVMTRAMTREMPKAYWKNMPETAQIPDMIRQAGARVDAMDGAPDAAPLFAERIAARRAAASEPDAEGLAGLKREAAKCAACPLHACATQTVFGEGPEDAKIMLVGEQPGDREDLAGRPFVGPAGQVLDRALAEAGLDRSRLYVTNAVKHFKHELRGKRRLHRTPDRGDIEHCRFWLRREIDALRPGLIVMLGATAVQAVTGRRLTISRERGRPLALEGSTGLITVHPSYLLRLPDEAARAAETERFTADLALAAWLAGAAKAA